MAKKIKNLDILGKWAAIIGLALAVIAPLIWGVYIIPSLALILVVLGLIIGFINIAEKDVIKLLLSIIVLMAIGSATLLVIPTISGYLIDILTNILVLAGAASLVVALKAILEIIKK